MFDNTDVKVDYLIDLPQSPRPVNADDDSDDTQYRPQRRVPAVNSSSQENSSLVVKGINPKGITSFISFSLFDLDL